MSRYEISCVIIITLPSNSLVLFSSTDVLFVKASSRDLEMPVLEEDSGEEERKDPSTDVGKRSSTTAKAMSS